MHYNTNSRELKKLHVCAIMYTFVYAEPSTQVTANLVLGFSNVKRETGIAQIQNLENWKLKKKSKPNNSMAFHT